MLTFICFWKMTKRDLMVASTRHHLARLLKYYPRRPCAPSLIKSRFFPYTTNLLTVLTFLLLKFFTCIHAGNPRVPPRVLASGPKPFGGNEHRIIIQHQALTYLQIFWEVLMKCTLESHCIIVTEYWRFLLYFLYRRKGVRLFIKFIDHYCRPSRVSSEESLACASLML